MNDLENNYFIIIEILCSFGNSLDITETVLVSDLRRHSTTHNSTLTLDDDSAVISALGYDERSGPGFQIPATGVSDFSSTHQKRKKISSTQRHLQASSYNYHGEHLHLRSTGSEYRWSYVNHLKNYD